MEIQPPNAYGVVWIDTVIFPHVGDLPAKNPLAQLNEMLDLSSPFNNGKRRKRKHCEGLNEGNGKRCEGVNKGNSKRCKRKCSANGYCCRHQQQAHEPSLHCTPTIKRTEKQDTQSAPRKVQRTLYNQ